MSSGFVTETELVEARRVRQEQWEKVRQSTEPIEAPEEPYDPRPLYQRLEEQKNKKEAEYEEAHKLKNMIRGLDDDEVGFLEMVEQSKATVARQISLEEQREMQDFRERMSSVQDSVEQERLNQIKAPPPKRTSTNSTRNLLQGVIVKKRKTSDSEAAADKDKANGSAEEASSSSSSTENNRSSESDADKNVSKEESTTTTPVVVSTLPNTMGALKCIGILPGIGPYRDSSDSECSSDSDDEVHRPPVYDLLGRKIPKNKEDERN